VGGFNLGLLMRTLFGIGTPRSLQGLVVPFRVVFTVLCRFVHDEISLIDTQLRSRTFLPLMTASSGD